MVAIISSLVSWVVVGIRTCATAISRRLVRLLLRRAFNIGGGSPVDVIASGVRPVTQTVAAIADHIPAPIKPADVLAAAQPVTHAVSTIAEHIPTPVDVIAAKPVTRAVATIAEHMPISPTDVVSVKPVTQAVAAIADHIPTKPTDIIGVKPVSQAVSAVAEHLPINPVDVIPIKPVTNAVASVAEHIPNPIKGAGETIGFTPSNWIQNKDQPESSNLSWTGAPFLKRRTNGAK